MGLPFYAYMVQCADGSYYVGQTDGLEKRILEHEEGGKCAYTEMRRPVKLAWSQEFATRVEASAAESQIKKWSRAKKQALIRGDFATVSQAAKKKNWETYRERRQRR